MLTPPIAKKNPKEIMNHNHTRIDEFFWLREKENPEVIQYLKEENAYTESVMASTGDLQKQLFEEMKGRMKETDMSAPVKIDDYFYYTRTEEGKQYPIFCRRKETMENSEEMLLDQNDLAQGYPFLSLGVFDVSPNHRLLSYSIDTTGAEIYTLFIKNLMTSEIYQDQLVNTGHSLEWFNDNHSFLYTTLDTTRRPDKVYRHVLGTTQEQDILLYQEMDERFSVGVSKSQSEKYLFIEVGSKVTSETHFLDADGNGSTLTLVNPRVHEHEYTIDHHGDFFYIRTNDDAKNFKLMKTPIGSPSRASWEDVIEHRDDVTLEGFSLFEKQLVLWELKNALSQIRFFSLEEHSALLGEERIISFEEEAYSVGPGENPNFKTDTLRFVYSSMITPTCVYEYHFSTGKRTLIKQKEIPSGYQAGDYETKRVYATASDGTRIPVSLAYKKSLRQSKPQKCLLYGYGSYGVFIEPGFSPTHLSLLDRGFIFVIAHIRGGGALGRSWYEQGKYLRKKNTFTDFIACAQYLIYEGYTDSGQLAIAGGSAGGLLMGSVLNMRPDLFFAAVAHVPFVDVVNTMLDPSLPLTIAEYEEWGNPQEKEYYDYIVSYDPYENVKEQEYPHLLVMAGLNDTRVQYWEPAKWVAKLRDKKTDSHVLLLKTNMDAGHGGASGRYDHLKEIVFEYAFLFHVFGIHS